MHIRYTYNVPDLSSVLPSVPQDIFWLCIWPMYNNNTTLLETASQNNN